MNPIRKPGFVAESDKGLTVVLDTNLTQALIDEGFVREIVSKLQTMRKDAGYEVTDRFGVHLRMRRQAGSSDRIGPPGHREGGAGPVHPSAPNPKATSKNGPSTRKRPPWAWRKHNPPSQATAPPARYGRGRVYRRWERLSQGRRLTRRFSNPTRIPP